MYKVEELRTFLERRKGERDQVQKSVLANKTKLRGLKKDLVNHEKARELIREAGLKTQKALSFHISEITTLALDAVFEEGAYKLEVDFVERRNKTECDLFFVRNGQRIDPLSASGGGAVDVASFALRSASWSMQTPRSRPVIILDEPLKYLSVNYQERASMMLKEISEKLGIQFIIITHEETLASFADKTFKVNINRRGKTIIK